MEISHLIRSMIETLSVLQFFSTRQLEICTFLINQKFYTLSTDTFIFDIKYSNYFELVLCISRARRLYEKNLAPMLLLAGFAVRVLEVWDIFCFASSRERFHLIFLFLFCIYFTTAATSTRSILTIQTLVSAARERRSAFAVRRRARGQRTGPPARGARCWRRRLRRTRRLGASFASRWRTLLINTTRVFVINMTVQCLLNSIMTWL